MKRVELSGKNFEKLPISEIYFTEGYYKKIEKEKTKEGGNYLDLISSGKGVRGFKHLLEKLCEKDSLSKIVFTDKHTCKKRGEWHINLEEYKKSVSGRFFALYRETGLDGAQNYLSQKMPDLFEYDRTRLSENDYKKVLKRLPEILDNLNTKRDKNAVVEQSLKITKELGDKRRKLKAEKEELEKIKNSSNIASIVSGLNEMDDRINGEKTYKETSGRNNWQSWLKEHSWVFGVFYGEPYEKEKIGFDNIPDYLFPTLDGFVDVYEIKLPSHKVIIADQSHNGSFVWSPEVNKAIGQCVNYLYEIETHQLELADRIKRKYGVEMSFIKPRAFVVIGSDKMLDSIDAKEALRKLNYSLHGIEVITYDDLKRRGRQMLKIYGHEEG